MAKGSLSLPLPQGTGNARDCEPGTHQRLSALSGHVCVSALTPEHRGGFLYFPRSTRPARTMPSSQRAKRSLCSIRRHVHLCVISRVGCSTDRPKPSSPSHLIQNKIFFSRLGGPQSTLYRSWNGSTCWHGINVSCALEEGAEHTRHQPAQGPYMLCGETFSVQLEHISRHISQSRAMLMQETGTFRDGYC